MVKGAQSRGRPAGDTDLESSRDGGVSETKLEPFSSSAPPGQNPAWSGDHSQPSGGHDAMGWAESGLAAWGQSTSDETLHAHSPRNKHVQTIEPDDTLTSKNKTPVCRAEEHRTKQHVPAAAGVVSQPAQNGVATVFNFFFACALQSCFGSAQTCAGLSSEARRISVVFRAPCPTTREPWRLREHPVCIASTTSTGAGLLGLSIDRQMKWPATGRRRVMTLVLRSPGGAQRAQMSETKRGCTGYILYPPSLCRDEISTQLWNCVAFTQ